MLLIKGQGIKKYYNNKIILDIDSFSIYSRDKIGIVGLNGAGKSTLLKLINSKIDLEEGQVLVRGETAVMSQRDNEKLDNIDSKMASIHSVSTVWKDTMSGGEKTRFKLANVFSKKSDILLMDEPTNNLDVNGIKILEKNLLEYDGAIVMISHDRELLNTVCSKIWEINDGEIKSYNGDYNNYRLQKEHEENSKKKEYEKYIKDKVKLEESIKIANIQINSIKTTPKRMGNSEARLHKMGGQRAEYSLGKNLGGLRSRKEHMKVKENIKKEIKMKIDFNKSNNINSKVAISGKKINKRFKEKTIFNDANFTIYTDTKVALLGENGSGKSTLLKMIRDRDSDINISKNVKIGYFTQNIDILDKEKTIFENITESTDKAEDYIRLILAGLLFRENDMVKKVSELSGGQLVKAAIAKIILQDINLLILDEPTNYLDIMSIEALERTLKQSDMTMIIISHDREFIKNIADTILIIENDKIITYLGNYQYYKEKENSKEQDSNIKSEILLLEHKLSEVLSQLSTEKDKDKKEYLNKIYIKYLEKIKGLRAI